MVIQIGLKITSQYENDKTYSSNSFYPKVNAEFIQNGKFRNKYFGTAKIYPVQFNPLNKSVRRVTYLRIRVAFGKSPVYSTKLQSKQEVDFLRNISINWENAINWVTPEFNSYKATVQNSVLATGDFFKIEVKETGIYKIDKNFLNSAGINTANIDPRTIKIYGNGGKELPYLNSAPVILDFEISTKIFLGILFFVILGALSQQLTINPYDYCLNAMNIRIASLTSDSLEYKMIEVYAK